MPWCNILTNGSLGAILSEKGISYLWYKNSREMPLTKWHNDALLDPCPIKIKLFRDGDFIYEYGSFSEDGSWQTVHSRGYSTYSVTVEGINIKITVFIDINTDSLILKTYIYNSGSVAADLKLELECNFVMGDPTGKYVVSAVKDGIISVKNSINHEINDIVLYVVNSISKENERSYEPGGSVKSICGVYLNPREKKECTYSIVMNSLQDIDYEESLSAVKSYWEKKNRYNKD